MMLDCTLIHLGCVCPLTSFQELKEILVDPLPVGCSLLVCGSLFRACFRIPTCCVLQAILDTCHSGTLLDLPHYHCNSVYVPWQSKGERRTMTIRNMNGWSPHYSFLSHTNIRLVRRQATGYANSTSEPPLSIEGAIEGDQPAVESLQLDTQLSEGRTAVQRELSPTRRSPRESRRPRERMLFSSQTRYASPEARFACDGWCKFSDDSHPNVVSNGRPLLRDGGCSCLSAALSICLFRLATRMGGAERLSDDGVVQLP
jgi:hypothetical protein